MIPDGLDPNGGLVVRAEHGLSRYFLVGSEPQWHEYLGGAADEVQDLAADGPEFLRWRRDTAAART